ncbi:MAG: hypothetical protein IT381_31660 [Deltaproteobacteria bacterium]|nr:hypothetical protein [Deltaproteobacteria bacterium]
MTGTDGALETITQMNPKAIHCFSLVAKPNTTRLPTASPQAFNVQLSANAETPNGDIPLGIIRDVTFIVPPNTD